MYFNTQFEKNRWFENTPQKPLKLRLFHARKSKNQNSQTVRICIFLCMKLFFMTIHCYKETGQYRKGELGLKPENIK